MPVGNILEEDPDSQNVFVEKQDLRDKEETAAILTCASDGKIVDNSVRQSEDLRLVRDHTFNLFAARGLETVDKAGILPRKLPQHPSSRFRLSSHSGTASNAALQNSNCMYLSATRESSEKIHSREASSMDYFVDQTVGRDTTLLSSCPKSAHSFPHESKHHEPPSALGSRRDNIGQGEPKTDSLFEIWLKSVAHQRTMTSSHHQQEPSRVIFSPLPDAEGTRDFHPIYRKHNTPYRYKSTFGSLAKDSSQRSFHRFRRKPTVPSLQISDRGLETIVDSLFNSRTGNSPISRLSKSSTHVQETNKYIKLYSYIADMDLRQSQSEQSMRFCRPGSQGVCKATNVSKTVVKGAQGSWLLWEDVLGNESSDDGSFQVGDSIDCCDLMLPDCQRRKCRGRLHRPRNFDDVVLKSPDAPSLQIRNDVSSLIQPAFLPQMHERRAPGLPVPPMDKDDSDNHQERLEQQSPSSEITFGFHSPQRKQQHSPKSSQTDYDQTKSLGKDYSDSRQRQEASNSDDPAFAFLAPNQRNQPLSWRRSRLQYRLGKEVTFAPTPLAEIHQKKQVQEQQQVRIKGTRVLNRKQLQRQRWPKLIRNQNGRHRERNKSIPGGKRSKDGEWRKMPKHKDSIPLSTLAKEPSSSDSPSESGSNSLTKHDSLDHSKMSVDPKSASKSGAHSFSASDANSRLGDVRNNGRSGRGGGGSGSTNKDKDQNSSDEKDTASSMLYRRGLPVMRSVHRYDRAWQCPGKEEEEDEG